MSVFYNYRNGVIQKMKPIFVAFLAMLMLLTFVACGEKEEATTVAETTTQAVSETTTEEETTEAVSPTDAVTSAKGNVTITPAGEWEYKGEYSANMLQFDNKAVSGSSVYISDKEDMEYEVQKKTVGYAYPDKEFEEIVIGDNTYVCMSSDTVIYLVAPTGNGNAIYVQVRGGTLDDAKVLLETLEIK